MKKLLVLLMMLLLWGTAAQADSAAPRAALEAACPDAKVIASAQDEDDAFFVLDMGDAAPQKLCSFTLLDGTWTMTLDSDRAIRPSGLSDQYTRWNYSSIALSLAENTLFISYQGWHELQYEFVKEQDGQWRFVRLYVADETNRIYEELVLADGCVTQSYIRKYRDGTQAENVTPPCPMPWLAGCESLAGFDASAFPMDLYAMNDEDLSRVAAQLLPEYAYEVGKFGWNTASFLMHRPDGALVFCGGVYEDGVWVWTESTPLPEDTWCDDYHSGGDAFIIGWDHPGGEPDEFGDYPYVEYVIYLQEDGSWKVESVFDYYNEWFHFEPDGLYINMTGLIYGESTLERDVTKIDWATYPLTLADVLPTMSHDWGVISEPSLPLYADTDESVLLAEYHCVTPVHILEEADDLAEKGWEGHLVKVQIADSDVVGWMQGYGMLTGQHQVWEQIEEDEDGDWAYLVTAEWEEAWYVELPVGANLYNSPAGDVIRATEYQTSLVFMADWGNGWAHVKFPESPESCFVRVEDCLPAEE